MQGLTKVDIEVAKSTIWEELCKGSTDLQIIGITNLRSDTYDALKKDLLDDKSKEFKSKPPEHVYAEYVIAQTVNIQDLTEMIKSFKVSKQYTAMVAAVKTRADLYDKLIAKGQEFGIFRKTPERREIVAGIMVQDMTHADLRSAIVNAIGNLEKMRTKFGDHNIMDAKPGTIHYGPRLPERGHDGEDVEEIVAPKGKTKKNTARAKMSKTTKASRGRKPFVKKEDK